MDTRWVIARWVILLWLHIDNQGIVLNAGFLCFGLVTLVDGIRSKVHKPFSFDTLKILMSTIIVILAAHNLFTGINQYRILAVAILLYIIAQRRGIDLRKSTR